MRIASLGSGSKGNATLVDTGETLLLIDCGLPRRDVEERLQFRGVGGQVSWSYDKGRVYESNSRSSWSSNERPDGSK